MTHYCEMYFNFPRLMSFLSCRLYFTATAIRTFVGRCLARLNFVVPRRPSFAASAGFGFCRRLRALLPPKSSFIDLARPHGPARQVGRNRNVGVDTANATLATCSAIKSSRRAVTGFKVVKFCFITPLNYFIFMSLCNIFIAEAATHMQFALHMPGEYIIFLIRLYLQIS